MSATVTLTPAAELEALQQRGRSERSEHEQASGAEGELPRIVAGAFGGAGQTDAVRLLRSPTLGSARGSTLNRAQQTYGNRFVQRAVASANGSSAAHLIQRQCACGTCERCAPTAIPLPTTPGYIQTRAAAAEEVAPSSTLSGSLPPSDSSGTPLDETSRRLMEPRFREGFSDVLIHTDVAAENSAKALQAEAYTTGRHIYFAAGKYAPSTIEGQHLLAHELAHTVQQKESEPLPMSGLLVSSPGNPLEREADRAADALVGGGQMPTLSGSATVVARDVERQYYSTSSAVTSPSIGITAEAWVAMHATNLIGKTGYELSLAEVGIPTPFVAWKEGQRRQFLIDFWQPFWAHQRSAWSIFTATLAPDRPASAVNAGRDCDPWDLGTWEWREAVVGEFYKLVVKRLMESLARMTPRWRSVSNQLALRFESGDANAGREPSPDEIFASHPIDRYVLAALPGKLDIDFKGYRKAYPEAATPREVRARLRVITFDFQLASGDWNWIRVDSPADATPEEVAKALYGDETKAYLLTAAAPLFGFERIDDLLPIHQKKYNELGLEVGPRAEVGPMHIPAMHEETPANQILSGPRADEAVLLQARQIRSNPSADPAAVLDRMRAIVRSLDRMRSEITTVGLLGGMESEMFVPVRDRVDQRSAKLAAASPAEISGWDAQSRGQFELVNAAENGLLMAKQQQEAFARWPSVKNVVSYIAIRYARVAQSSELVETGRWWLNFADEQSRLFPVTLMDLLLAELRNAILVARPEKTGVVTAELHEALYGIAGMDQREKKLRAALVKVRDVVLQHPEQAKAALDPIFKEIEELQVEVTLVTSMDQTDQAWRALYESLSVTGAMRSVWGGGNATVMAAASDALRLNDEWRQIYREYEYGDKEKAKKQLTEKSKSDEWMGFMDHIREVIADQATYDKWMTFALMAGIAILTAGIGVYVEAAAGAAWGTAAGFAASTVVEAATFTSLSYTLVTKDPSIAGFFDDFGKNLLTFGALKTISRIYRLGVGAEGAESAAGRVGEVLVQFVALNGAALYQADQEKRKRTGQGLTAAEIGETSLNNLAFVVAVSIGGKLAQPWIKELRLTGEVQGHLMKVKSTQAQLLDLSDTVKAQGGKDPTLARRMLAKQTELLALEERALTRLEQIAADPKAAAAAGLTSERAKSIAAAREEFAGALEQLQQAQVASQLEAVASNDFLCPKGDLFNVLKDMFFPNQGAVVNELQPDPVTHSRTIEVHPKEGTPFRVTERLSTAAGETGRGAEMLPFEEQPLPEPLRLGSEYENLPEYMRQDRLRNPPAIDPARIARMRNLLRNYRRQPSVPRRIDISGEPGVEGGTAAVSQTDIRTLTDRSFPGASAEALPDDMRGAPGTSGGEVFRAANPTAVDHAEHVSLENVRRAIDGKLARGEIQRSDLNGRTVFVLVEQEPCPSCAAGAGGGASGVLEQFSARYPELTVEVRNLRTNRAYIYRGGRLLNP
jgi:hypothetical protein